VKPLAGFVKEVSVNPRGFGELIDREGRVVRSRARHDRLEAGDVDPKGYRGLPRHRVPGRARTFHAKVLASKEVDAADERDALNDQEALATVALLAVRAADLLAHACPRRLGSFAFGW
jgi:hypothetical protein